MAQTFLGGYPTNLTTYRPATPAATGSRPGSIGMPNPAADLANQYPNLSATNAQLSTDIMAQLSGQLSPSTLRQMQDMEAQQAAAGGMPGTNMMPGSLFGNRSVRDLGLSTEAQVRAGEAAYNPAISTISGTQTLAPAINAEVQGTNALNASAPDPTAAANYAQQLYNDYLTSMGGGGGPAGGTGNASASRPEFTDDGRQIIYR